MIRITGCSRVLGRHRSLLPSSLVLDASTASKSRLLEQHSVDLVQIDCCHAVRAASASEEPFEKVSGEESGCLEYLSWHLSELGTGPNRRCQSRNTPADAADDLKEHYIPGGMLSSVTKYCFDESVQAGVVTDDWVFLVQRLKSVLDELVDNKAAVMAGSTHGVVRSYAKPYHYTDDDILSVPHNSLELQTSKWSFACGEENVITSGLWECPEDTLFLNQQMSYGRSSDVDSIYYPANNCLADLCEHFHIQGGGHTSLADGLNQNLENALQEKNCLYGSSLSTINVCHPNVPAHQSVYGYFVFHDRFSEVLCDSQNCSNYGACSCRLVSPLLLASPMAYCDTQISLNRQLTFSCGQPLMDDKNIVPDEKPEKRGLPDADQLRMVQETLVDEMPKLFIRGHDYSMYTEDVVFENSWYPGRSYATAGQWLYSLEVAKLRLYVHIRLANVRVQLLKVTSHPEDGTVRVRWRVAGIPQARAVMFWKFLPGSARQNSSETEWLDGFSTFFIDGTGTVYKHKMDRMIPDEGEEVKVKPSLIEKLAGITAPAAT